jgi:short-subunit dehydrogenase
VELRGSNALLTGAAGGLAAYIGRALAAEGVNLALSDLPGTDLAPLADELSATGVRVEQVAADLADPEQLHGLLDEAEEALGSIDILVNNAGVVFATPFTEATPQQIELITAVNVRALMELTRQAVPRMLGRGRGHVVNLASMAGKVGAPYLAAYSGSKHAVVGFTQSLRTELGSEPVGFSAICPTYISRVGMYGRLEDELPEPPRDIATMPPEAVGDAVVKAIRENRAEVRVTKGPARSLIFLYALAPGLAARLVRRRQPVIDHARRFAEVESRRREEGRARAAQRD